MRIKIDFFADRRLVFNPKGSASCCVGSLLSIEETAESRKLRHEIFQAQKMLKSKVNVKIELINICKKKWPEGVWRDYYRFKCAFMKFIFNIKSFPAFVIRHHTSLLPCIFRKSPFRVVQGHFLTREKIIELILKFSKL